MRRRCYDRTRRAATLIQFPSAGLVRPYASAYALTEERIRAAKDADLGTCGVSVDGLEDLHDEIRGVKGSFRSAMTALELLGQVRHS